MPCPWGESETCAYGDPDRTYSEHSAETPFGSFYQALKQMRQHQKSIVNRAERNPGHYTLLIRGGLFSYTEPLVIAPYGVHIDSVSYSAPMLLDEDLVPGAIASNRTMQSVLSLDHVPASGESYGGPL